MKKLLVTAALLAASSQSFATTKHVHNWKAGSSQNWHSAIILTNVCNKDNTDVVVKFWDSTGAVLSNRTLSAGNVTNSEGEMTFTLEPHQSTHIQISAANFSKFTYGSASVSSYYAESGVECLTGSHHSYYYASVGGHGLSYLLNGGEPF
ncbi:hypothetical protein [Pseudoalteromonas peptidolytica]|uniref:Uncharacterized protein n=1 Tax=Pseudoalteromonas peptidolytica F12-50-A1 TaxID=1315280 RepID=A0A8I0MW02_9GAMM|nr:hypothetical protein [Pseudoalteromonas peptidolytica]MBE0346897.1 hypothetical protein [Pseudoalteromonas peptidolytica F12-50-A1]NLR13798.1 hypothetical protein [Pseudoalteromonas peptidolytica]GEK09509.1 hypothetical protein PPE03_17580 [Pseudoalteromonas peptidolytica]